MNSVLPTVIVVSGTVLWMGVGTALLRLVKRSHDVDTHPDAWAKRISVTIFCIGMALAAVWIMALGKMIWMLVLH